MLCKMRGEEKSNIVCSRVILLLSKSGSTFIFLKKNSGSKQYISFEMWWREIALYDSIGFIS
jgi:hypothetical protein